ncbi:MAG: aminomethyl-transferring glycine dehydrogenase subunit GcvPA [Deltaproteobacteria bacterium]|nr:aminomethyl-transferring glycine dehydrogenase subunit GcvPA [Deltaproteobacteria bacterium]
MPYIPHTEDDIRRLLDAIGVSAIEDLLAQVPSGLRLKAPLALPKGLSEQELKGHLSSIAAKNRAVDSISSFLGAGAYNHYIPSVVGALASRSEFYTAYTPYQPEASQGTLQAIFEYQTLVCQLTGMDVSNASLYDGASATAEAVLMAMRLKNGKALLSSALHPEYRETVAAYLNNSSCGEIPYCAETGTTLPSAVEARFDGNVSCLVVQSPNFFGPFEDIGTLAKIAHKNNALFIVVITEPLSLGLVKGPGDLGADIVVGEAQSFGTPLNFGGPYLGFMATKDESLRQMPGRIVGQTRDRNNNRAFCLTLATREQHIRRGRATSNICTNEGLSALSAAIYLASLGSTGLRKLAYNNLCRLRYLRERLSMSGIRGAFTGDTFNEVTIRLNVDPETAVKALIEKNIIPGLSLKRFYPELKDCILTAVTEENSMAEIDALALALAAL